MATITAMDTVATSLGLATVADAAVIARLSRDEIERGLSWRWRPAAIRHLINDPETTVLRARCRRGVTTVVGGFGIMEFGLERAHLILLAVAPRLRRQGLASGILHWLEGSAITAGIGEIRLEVRADNGGAQKFYIAEGFQRGGYMPGFYQDRVAAYRMTKKLPAAG